MIERAVFAFLAVTAIGCAPENAEVDDDDDTETESDALSFGVNGGTCLKSPYNCKLRISGGNRVENAQGGLWAVRDDNVIDGNGVLMGVSTWDHLRFTHGQTRHINGADASYAARTSPSNKLR